MQEGDNLPTIRKTVTQQQIHKYAEVSGDFNPAHVDHEFAAKSQFGGTIAHGMMVAAAVSEMMAAAFGREWAECGRLKIKFRAPVFPGDTITSYGRVKSVVGRDNARQIVCSVGVRMQNGEEAITGEAVVLVHDNTGLEDTN